MGRSLVHVQFEGSFAERRKDEDPTTGLPTDEAVRDEYLRLITGTDALTDAMQELTKECFTGKLLWFLGIGTTDEDNTQAFGPVLEASSDALINTAVNMAVATPEQPLTISVPVWVDAAYAERDRLPGKAEPVPGAFAERLGGNVAHHEDYLDMIATALMDSDYLVTKRQLIWHDSQVTFSRTQ